MVSGPPKTPAWTRRKGPAGVLRRLPASETVRVPVLVLEDELSEIGDLRQAELPGRHALGIERRLQRVLRRAGRPPPRADAARGAARRAGAPRAPASRLSGGGWTRGGQSAGQVAAAGSAAARLAIAASPRRPGPALRIAARILMGRRTSARARAKPGTPARWRARSRRAPGTRRGLSPLTAMQHDRVLHRRRASVVKIGRRLGQTPQGPSQEHSRGDRFLAPLARERLAHVVPLEVAEEVHAGTT